MQLSKFLTLLMALLSCTFLAQCHSNDHELHGYVEGQLTYLSSPAEGKLLELMVKRGQQVKQAAALFTLDPLPESAELEFATASVNQAHANLNNLLVGKRPTELDAIRSQINEIKAKITFLQKEHQRYKILVSRSAIEQERLDRTVQDLAISTAQLKALEANLSTAKLPAREQEIKAAEATLTSTQAQFNKAHWILGEKELKAPLDGQVFDTYYKVGERVPANHPILSLLIPQDIIAVFFVPEEQLASTHLQQKITILCDHCQSPYQGLISFISPEAQYTPPVIYSNSARSKLVYRVEAQIIPQDGKKLNPGQPIDIVLNGNTQ